MNYGKINIIKFFTVTGGWVKMSILNPIIFEAKELKKHIFVLILFNAILLSVAFFGIIGFFSPAMFLVGMIMFYMLLIGPFICLKGLFKPGWNRKLINIVLGVLATCFYIYITMPAYSQLHEYGVELKFKRHNDQLAAMCEKILKEKNNDKEKTAFSLRKYDSFDIWPSFLSPTRNYGHIRGRLLLLNFEGSPDGGKGVLYFQGDPEKDDTVSASLKSFSARHMFGPWYRFEIY